MSERERGVCKWFSPDKGWGFITRPGKRDLFVHHSSIDMEGFRTLHEGQEVEFTVEDGKKGPQAIEVRPL